MKSPSFRMRGFAVFSFVASLSSGQVLMLDFGPTTAIDDVGAADSLTNSPYHSVSAGAGTTWNRITGDFLTNVKWADDSDANAVSINLGSVASSGGTMIGLNNGVNNVALTGTAVTGGVYGNTSVARDGVFASGASNSQNRAVGLQIGGLPAGTYTVYVTGRNTNTSLAQTQNFYLGKSASAGDFTFISSGTTPAGGYELESLSYSAYSGAGETSEPAWVLGGNYQSFTLTVLADEFVNLAVRGGAGDARGFINSLQIVAVPEPSAYAALAGVAALAGGVLRRRCRA